MNWYKKSQTTLDPNLELLKRENPTLYQLLRSYAPEGLKHLQENPKIIENMIGNPALENQIKYYLQNLYRNKDFYSPESFWGYVDILADKVNNFISTWILY